MKKIFLIASLALVISSCGNGEVEVGQKTTMFVEKIYEVGTVVKGEKVVAKIQVENTGTYPLVIAQVSPGCSCTIASKPEEPIQPGEKGIITATVDSDKVAGNKISKSVSIVANTEPSTTVVVIKGKIKN
ncbi:MAG: DUF1573 domain-containing protein [Bacteroidota bacterium]